MYRACSIRTVVFEAKSVFKGESAYADAKMTRPYHHTTLGFDNIYTQNLLLPPKQINPFWTLREVCAFIRRHSSAPFVPSFHHHHEFDKERRSRSSRKHAHNNVQDARDPFDCAYSSKIKRSAAHENGDRHGGGDMVRMPRKRIGRFVQSNDTYYD